MNNADSFAMAFDETWKTTINNSSTISDLDQMEKINLVLSKIKGHPFLENQPAQALEVAKFRLRLLKLN
tara:strand:+ start:6080 stop:6286 length:207 start_codon:yes stop_codon:yes gene_type:complete